MIGPREYLTPFGWVAVERRLYQADTGGDCYAPLDEKWGMREETPTPTVREASHFATGHNTPEEVEKLFAKCALFNPSRTAIQHANEGFGILWKQHGESILTKVTGTRNRSFHDQGHGGEPGGRKRIDA